LSRLVILSGARGKRIEARGSFPSQSFVIVIVIVIERFEGLKV